jgi:hypothetical protein
MIQFAIDHGHVPTREQMAILLEVSDAATAPFDEFDRGLGKNLQERYAKKSKSELSLGKLNEHGPYHAKRFMTKIREYGLGSMNRGPFPVRLGEKPNMKGMGKRTRRKRKK